MGQGSGTSAGDHLMGGRPSRDQQALAYRAPIPDIVTKYMQNLTKGGFLDLPSFNELFGSYRKLGEREANRQSAAINEAFGSQGNRYSSDLLAGQSRLRENLFDQFTNKAAEYQTGLRQQQFTEASGVANLLYGANEAAMSRFFQDFLRRTSPPPLFETAVGVSGQYGLPPLVV